MNRVLCSVVVVVLAVSASSAMADWTVGAPVDFRYDLTSPRSFSGGTPLGGFVSGGSYVYGPVGGSVGAPTSLPGPGRGYFGAQWDGPVSVSTIEIFLGGPSMDRLVPEVIYAYTSATTYVEIRLEENRLGYHKIELPEPIIANNSYLMLAVQKMHPRWEGGGTDVNFPMNWYAFTATAIGPADVNYNRQTGVTATRTMGMSSDPPGAAPDLINGKIIDAEKYFTRGLNTTERDAFTVTYNPNALPEAINVIGLAFGTGDSPSRDCPKWVTISDGVFTETIMISEVSTQYCRYELKHTFLNPASLTITMPPAAGDATDAANWWILGDKNYSVSEFQAFYVVPEPLTMTLLAAGGLAMLRRRT